MAANGFESWDEVALLVSQFESGELPHADWNHREHLTVALWFVSRLEEAAALDRIREGVLFLNRLPRHSEHGHARVSRNLDSLLDRHCGEVPEGARRTAV